MTAESGIFVDSQDSVIITTEGSLTETTPDSSSTLFVMWQTLERKMDGIAEKGLFDEFIVLILIQYTYPPAKKFSIKRHRTTTTR